MKLLQNWRIIALAFLVVWCVILIHPFTKNAVEVTTVESPASFVLRSTDFVYSINSEKVTSMGSFNSILQNVKENDSCQVAIERETFPYTYRQIVHNYITNTGDNPVGFYAKPSAFSKLKFNAQFQESNKFTIKTSDPDSTIDVLSKRLKIDRIPDYMFKTQGSDVVLYTASGEELRSIIDANGNFEAKIGNEIFFTDKDITRYCISGVDCMVHTYPMLNQSSEGKEVVWKYGFETHLSQEASERFVPLAQNLGILTCEYDRCVLNETMDYYVDGEKVGFDNIYATDKSKNMSIVFIGGETKTQADALYSLHFLQSVLQGRTDAKITSMETAPPLLGENAIKMVFVVIAAIIIINSVLLLIIFKDIKISAVALAITASETIILLGMLAGLKITITLFTVLAIVLAPLISLIYQNYSVSWIKKEGMILRKIMELNSMLNKIFWVAVIIITMAVLLKPDFAAPLVIYLLLAVIITKGLFFRAIKAKEM